MTEAAAPAPPRRGFLARYGLYVPTAIFLALCLGWSIFWYVAANQTGRTLDAWLAREHELGRDWTCPDRSIGGYPFRIELRCAKPTFTGAIRGSAASGSLGALRALAQLYEPNHIVAEADGPLTIDAPQGQTTITWSLLQISLAGTPQALQRASLEIKNLGWTLAMPAFGETRGRADHAAFHARSAPGRPVADHAYDIAWRVDAATVPLIDRLAGNEAPTTAELIATLAQADFTGEGSPAEKLERWRTAGGQLGVTSLVITKGDARITANGPLALDDQRRIAGRLDIEASGIGGLLARFGVPPQIGMLGGLLGGGPPRKANDPQALRLALTFADGRIGAGPLRLPFVLFPLYAPP